MTSSSVAKNRLRQSGDRTAGGLLARRGSYNQSRPFLVVCIDAAASSLQILPVSISPLARLMFLVLPTPEQPGLPDRVAPETHDEPPLEPAALAAAFLADDAAAAWVLESHLLPLVTRLVHRLSAWSNDGDDLVQDVLVTALVKRRTFNAQSKLETWITRITINRCRTHQRKQWLRSKLFRAWAARDALSKRPVKSPEESAVTNEQAETVRSAVANLPAPSREAIVLCYLEGLTVTEAAEALAVRRGTLEVRLSRARAQLRDALAGMLADRFAANRERE